MKRLTHVLLGLLLVFGLTLAAFVALNWAPDRPLDELKARWAPPPSQFVDIDGMSVHLRDQGRRDDPEPILLLHGTSASLHTWEGWVKELAKQRRVISLDLPGFGLAGHLLEICQGSSLSADVQFDTVPLIPLAAEIAQSGTATGASARNWDGYGSSMVLPAGFEKWKQNLLSDPQTSGGLLIACAPEAAEQVLALLRAEDFGAAAVIGSLAAGAAQVSVS